MQFEVDRVMDNHVIAGRNNGDENIPVGSVFNKVIKYKFQGPINDLRRIDLGVVAIVSLELTGVSFYGRTIDCIPGGHTAGITLKGKGFQSLSRILESLEDREYVSLAIG